MGIIVILNNKMLFFLREYFYICQNDVVYLTELLFHFVLCLLGFLLLHPQNSVVSWICIISINSFFSPWFDSCHGLHLLNEVVRLLVCQWRQFTQFLLIITLSICYIVMFFCNLLQIYFYVKHVALAFQYIIIVVNVMCGF